MKTKVRLLSNIKNDHDWSKLEEVGKKITDYLFYEYGIVLDVKGNMLIGDISLESAENLLRIASFPNSECDIADKIEELADETVKFAGISFDFLGD